MSSRTSSRSPWNAITGSWMVFLFWWRYSTNDRTPPSNLKVLDRCCSPRVSMSSMLTPRLRNASSRSRDDSMSKLNSIFANISGSGSKRVMVP